MSLDKCDFCGGNVGLKTYKMRAKNVVLCSECFQNVVMDTLDRLVEENVIEKDVMNLFLSEMILSALRDGIQFKHVGCAPLTEDLRQS